MRIRLHLMIYLICGLLTACSSSQQPAVHTQPDASIIQEDATSPQARTETDTTSSPTLSLDKLDTFIKNLSPHVTQERDNAVGQQVSPQHDALLQDLSYPNAERPVAFQVQIAPNQTELSDFKDNGQGYKLNFEGASIYDVTKVVSEITKKSFIIDTDVEEQEHITIYSDELLMPNQIFALYKSALELNGLTVTQVGDFYKITKNDVANTNYMPIYSGLAPNDEDRLITRIEKLQHITAGAAKNALKSLVSKGKEIGTYPNDEGDTLIIADTSANVRKILSILATIDVSQYTGQQFEIFRVQHADLLDLVDDLRQILLLQDPNVTATVEGQPAQSTQTQPGSTEGQEAGQPSQAASSTTGPGNRTRLYAIPRLDSLVVSTNNPEVIAKIRQWIAILDQPSVQGYNSDDEQKSDSPYHFYRVKYGDAENIATLLEDLYKKKTPSSQTAETEGGNAEATVEEQSDPNDPVFIKDKENNSIVIKATEEQYAEITVLLEQLDQRPLQVLIDVIIAEVTLDDSELLGIRGMLFGQDQLSIGGENNTVEGTAETVLNSVMPDGAEGFLYTMTAPGRFLAKLRALATENKLKVLSDPHILVRHNQTATMNVGGRIPVKETTGSGDDVKETIKFESIGIQLTVTPQITPEGDVAMDIEQKISAVGQERFGDTGAASFDERETKTKVITQDGHPLVLGGLITNRDEITETGVPLLRDIPWLGRLFRHTEKKNRRSDLFILVTPRVIRTPDQGWIVTDDVLHKRVKELEDIFNREDTDSDKIKDFLQDRFRIREYRTEPESLD